jgi:hypothetical protein
MEVGTSKNWNLSWLTITVGTTICELKAVGMIV